MNSAGGVPFVLEPNTVRWAREPSFPTFPQRGVVFDAASTIPENSTGSSANRQLASTCSPLRGHVHDTTTDGVVRIVRPTSVLSPDRY